MKANDSVFRFVFPTRNGEEMSDDVQKLYDACECAIHDNENVLIEKSC